MNGLWIPLGLMVQRTVKAWWRLVLAPLPKSLVDRYFSRPEIKNFKIQKQEDLSQELGFEMKKSGDVCIELGSNLFLEHSFPVNRAEKRELANVVKYEAARIMPLKPERMGVGFKIGGDRKPDGARVTLVGTKMDYLDQIAMFARQHQIQLCAVQAKSSAGPIHFDLPLVRKLLLTRAVLRTCFFVALVTAIAGLPWVYVQRLNEGLTQLERSIAIARQSSSQVAGMQELLETRQKFAEAIRDIKARGQIVELLNLLTKEAPDTVWLDEVRIELGRLYLKGYALSPEEWSLQLQSVPAISDVRLLTVRGVQGRGEHQEFELNAQLSWEELGGHVDE